MAEDKLLFEKICGDLVELKDTSEMMIDLAYSALLYNSRQIAEEVMMLEERMDDLHTEFELLVLSSRGEPEDARELLGLIRMGVVTERIADAAAEIAEVVLRGEETHPVLRMVIEDAEETVDRVLVTEGSPVLGKTLREARIPQETGMWVLVIRRGNKWMRPKPSTVLEAGDVVMASGYADGEEDFRKLVGGDGEQVLPDENF
ncbi:MAG: potassium channel protein [Candidatus Bathyarchaeota archaeon]|nr:potassium channel protein [Candidatus Bathyarchaeota archaeon]MDH5791668.1 potassium channel protein [Candidatus Bathyarchaeota archaeon]